MGYTPAPQRGGYTGTVGPRPEDLNPNRFSPAGNGLSQHEAYSIYDRPIPERTDFFARHANYAGFATMLSLMGASRGTSTPLVGHYEDPWDTDVITVGQIITASTGPGTNVVLELAASSMYNTAVTNGGQARKASFILENDIFELPDRTRCIVLSKNITTDPHRITVRPIRSSVDLAGRIVNGTVFGISDNAFPEGSGLPGTRAPRVIKYQNTLQITKTAMKITGSEMTNSVYHEVLPGQPSTAGESIMLKMDSDSVRDHEHKKSHLLLFGQLTDNVTITSSTEVNLDLPVTTTEGFVEFSLTSGTQDTYTVGAWTLTDLYDISQVYYDERSAAKGDIMGWSGPEYTSEVEQSFTQTMQQNLIYTVDRIIPGYASYLNNIGYQEMLDSKDGNATLSFGYDCVKVNGLFFHMKRLSEFNDIKRLGGDAYAYRNYCIYWPVSWTKDLLSNNSRSTIGYEYKQLGSYSRENIFGDLVGAGPGGNNTPYGKAVHQYDTMQRYMIAEIGGHWALGNQLIVQKPE